MIMVTLSFVAAFFFGMAISDWFANRASDKRIMRRYHVRLD